MFNNVILQIGVAYKNHPFYYHSLEKVENLFENLFERNDEIYGVKRISFVPMILIQKTSSLVGIIYYKKKKIKNK